MANPQSSSTYQQSGPSAPQTARAVLASPANQQRSFGNVPAKLKTNFGVNADLLIQARAAGAGGEAITVEIVVLGNNTPFSISVTGNAITINAATDGAGNSISLAADVRDALNTNADSSLLVTAVTVNGDGSKPVEALSSTALSSDVTATIGQGGSQPLPKQHSASNTYA